MSNPSPDQFRIKLIDSHFVSYKRPGIDPIQVATKNGLLFLAPSQISRILGVSSAVFSSTLKEVLSASGENKSAYSAYFKVLRHDAKPFMMQFFSTDLAVKVGKHFDSPGYRHFCKWLADGNFFAIPDELSTSIEKKNYEEKNISPPLDIYFDLGEFSPEEIGDIIQHINELYKEIGGDEIVIVRPDLFDLIDFPLSETPSPLLVK